MFCGNGSMWTAGCVPILFAGHQPYPHGLQKWPLRAARTKTPTCRLYTTFYDIRAAGTKHCNGSVVAHDIVTASLSRYDVK
eukprot:scaffold239778_cov29-Attheya_sp.AAC.1